MIKKNSIFIATSIDGYIADKNDEIDWLYNVVPNPDEDDMGYFSFIENIDALVMGRKTFETVSSFPIDWPYSKPVFVLSHSLEEVPEKLEGKVFLLKGSLWEVLSAIHDKGHGRLYIDGGTTIQQFLKEDLIDEMIITTIPILLGGGASLFGAIPQELKFELLKSNVFLNQITQNHFKRKK